MPKCVVIAGGWVHDGQPMVEGMVLQESAEWIANRVADIGARHPEGLVRPIEPEIEKATKKAKVEKAVSARGED